MVVRKSMANPEELDTLGSEARTKVETSPLALVAAHRPRHMPPSIPLCVSCPSLAAQPIHSLPRQRPAAPSKVLCQTFSGVNNMTSCYQAAPASPTVSSSGPSSYLDSPQAAPAADAPRSQQRRDAPQLPSLILNLQGNLWEELKDDSLAVDPSF
uniref:Uncharacterized protein n=1 Tax=Sphaerodactylus townsendi TaxID=933632 RepID=A0ACB8ED38_9SAUR